MEHTLKHTLGKAKKGAAFVIKRCLGVRNFERLRALPAIRKTCHIELPVQGDHVDSTLPLLQGWICAAHPIKNVLIRDDTGEFKKELQFVPRKDVEQAFSGAHVYGFREFVFVGDHKAKAPWKIEYTVNGSVNHSPVHFGSIDVSESLFYDSKKRKFDRLSNILFCPACLESRLEWGTSDLTCPTCHKKFGLSDTTLSFLPQGASTVDPGDQQCTSYDARSIEIITRNKGGLVLDFGSGVRRQFYDHVVSIDILDSFTIDIANMEKFLPFASNSFDAAISLSVLEHLRDPFHWVKEIIRVLKPGGELYFTVPFLAPFHGYPDHYYNMTLNGLRNILGEQVTIVEDGVYDYGKPVWTLSWFLNSYLKGLPENVAAEFREKKVKDLLNDPMLLKDAPFVKKLDTETEIELACVNYIAAKKREE